MGTPMLGNSKVSLPWSLYGAQLLVLALVGAGWWYC